jgi:glutamate-1-semialdehyde aminotransferase
VNIPNPEKRAYRYYDLVMVLFVTVLILSSIVSLLGDFPWGIWATLVVSNYLFKVGTGVHMTPATFSGNPLAMAAGIATSRVLEDPQVWAGMRYNANRLMAGMKEILDRRGITAVLQSVGTMFTLFFTSHPVANWRSVKLAGPGQVGNFFRALVAGDSPCPIAIRVGFPVDSA